MQKRDSWIDCLKAFGMILVFHGHVIEIAFGDQRSGALYHQFQYIYSFHIPLFFFLSGYVAKAPSGTFSRFIRGKFFTLVVPASFFVLLIHYVLVHGVGEAWKFFHLKQLVMGDEALWTYPILGPEHGRDYLEFTSWPIRTAEVLLNIHRFDKVASHNHRWVKLEFLQTYMPPVAVDMWRTADPQHVMIQSNNFLVPTFREATGINIARGSGLEGRNELKVAITGFHCVSVDIISTLKLYTVNSFLYSFFIKFIIDFIIDLIFFERRLFLAIFLYYIQIK